MGSWIRIAHRGASGSAPENTLVAFKKAIEIGVDAVELDLHGTADGEVVVIHDSSFDRTTNLRASVNQATLEMIKRADAGGWFAAEFAGEPVPTLEEALECITQETIAVLEIKDPLIAEAVVAKIHKTDTLDLTVIISFHTSVLRTVRTLEPRIPTGWLIGNHNKHLSPIHLCQQLGELGSSLLNVNHQLITAEFAYEVRRRGIALWCWTVDDIPRMREMKEFGVQGITSNYPERFAKI
ncbi:MAG: glycerophosphodiester phosphodiesterase family protein [Candidatus Poribacteria bacterium]|nr:glycerophosphodiester phosphodiesterase family protein [Candidatus Poribacteria bacterium]